MCAVECRGAQGGQAVHSLGLGVSHGRVLAGGTVPAKGVHPVGGH